jgi:tripartite-type tricarboxylate transporter receptor subunit TctC
MRFSRRIFLRLVAATTGLPLMPGLASAEVYPSRPVRMIVDIPAGLAPDVLARLIGEPLSHRLGQNLSSRTCRAPGETWALSTSYGRHRMDTPFW